jgi:glycosyltransferase involved in cell wall biosynthesis
MTNTDYYFINPHTNHSYFTLRSLSRLGPVEVLCPPLTFQLLLRQWSMDGIRLKYTWIGCLLAQPIALLAYVVYAFRLIKEPTYLFWLQQSARIILMPSRNRQIVYCYQDYLLDLMKTPQRQARYFVSEFIIQIPYGLANHVSSLKAAQKAHFVLTPTKMIKDELKCTETNVFIVPYGGDKHRYRSNKRLIELWPQYPANNLSITSQDTDLIIAARSNSHRKGLDLLLKALLAISARSDLSFLSKIQVVICGSVSPGPLLTSLQKAQNEFSATGSISLSWGQLSQDSYAALLKRSSLFLMPSRLEGSSYAAIEALSMGVPALLSKQCGVETFKPDYHGLLIDVSSAKSLELALKRVLVHPRLLQDWRSNLQVDRGLFTWDYYLDGVAKAVGSI